MDNSIWLVGRITRDPELQTMKNGIPRIRLNLAVPHFWYDKATRTRLERKSYFEVVAFHELAVNASETLLRGDNVIVVGELLQQHFRKADGDDVAATEVSASHIGVDLRSTVVEVIDPD